MATTTTTTVIKDFDYLVVGCGYTHRLIKHLEDIREKTCEVLESGSCEDPSHEDSDEHCQKCLKKNVVYLYSNSCFCKCSVKEHHLVMCGDSEDVDCVKSLVNENQIYGSICFGAGNLYEAFEVVRILIKYEHCACFSQIPYSMELVSGSYKDRDVKILVMHFDTESG